MMNVKDKVTGAVIGAAAMLTQHAPPSHRHDREEGPNALRITCGRCRARTKKFRRHFMSARDGRMCSGWAYLCHGCYDAQMRAEGNHLVPARLVKQRHCRMVWRRAPKPVEPSPIVLAVRH